MWIYTTYGFYSVVKHRDRRQFIQVRARKREHLENLLKEFWPGETEDRPIINHTPDGDYHYRINVHYAYWAGMVSEMADHIDYDNFKQACHDRMNDPDYEHTLFEVWNQTQYLLDPDRFRPDWK